jgi:hypothetical protein
LLAARLRLAAPVERVLAGENATDAEDDCPAQDQRKQ